MENNTNEVQDVDLMKEVDEEIHAIGKDIRHMGGLKQYFRSLFNIKDGMMSYAEIDAMMLENTVIHGPNMWILMLAILIASIGLNVNSTAVIIGAMLISPLMSGIMTMGFSLAVRDLSLLRRALIRFGTQVLISLATSTIYFLISPLSAPTAEMIARTSPTLWDVLIALFGGIAGMIGNTRTKKSNVIPGVAIATALMPPLCTAGYGIATLQPKFFFGAFYLFLINTLFISLSTALVTLILRVPYHKNISEKRQKKINIGVGIIMVVAIIPSVYIGAKTVVDSVIDNNISNYLSSEFTFTDTQVVKSTTDKKNRTISVSLVGAVVSDDVIGVLQNELDKYGLSGYTLYVTQNRVEFTETDDTDKITIAMQENRISELQRQLDEQSAENEELRGELADFKASAESAVDILGVSEKAAAIFPELSQCSAGVISDGSGEAAVLIAKTNAELSETDSGHIENWLKSETGLPRCVLMIEYIEPVPETAESAETADTAESA
ncbi:MAG: DUF389 domain-containing protein [Oscillospiraceae bacterium]